MIPMFIKSYAAATTILGARFAAFASGDTDTSVATATAATDPIIGVSDAMGAEEGDQLDIHLAGLVPITLGGAVEAGQPLTSDAEGCAVAATAVAGSTVHVAGFAHAPGEAGDIIDMWLAPGVIVTA